MSRPVSIASFATLLASCSICTFAQSPAPPGAQSRPAILQVTVRDIDSTVKALKAAGGAVVSKNGEPVMNVASRFCMVSDPNNVFLKLFQRAARPK